MLEKVDIIKVYMQEIVAYPLLNGQDEVDLSAQIKAGSEEARKTLIRSNLRLVVKIAHDFKGLGLPLTDLISEGNIGLMKAVERFDPTKGAKFSSYASWWIKQAMRRALANQSRTIRIPIQSAAKINRITEARRQLRQDLGRHPTDGEIAELIDVSMRTVADLKDASLKHVSLNEPIASGDDNEFGEIIPDPSATAPDMVVGHLECLQYMLHLLDSLEDREQAILRLRFGLSGEPPKTLEEVSQYVGCTRERVRQLQNRALIKLRELMGDDVPPPQA